MTQPKTDLVLANESLVELKINVTASVRKAAPASEATVIKYLNGLGTDLDISMKLLGFFRGRIETRRKLLNATEAQS